jgi:hypothetical protein
MYIYLKAFLRAAMYLGRLDFFNYQARLSGLVWNSGKGGRQ